MLKISPSDYYRMYKARGWRYPFRYFFQSHLFDILRGTDTHFWVSPDNYRQQSGKSDAVHYVACPTETIRRSLAAVHAHAGINYSCHQFIDLGCGKGKSLLTYSEYSADLRVPMALGIELVDSLANIARENIRICKQSENIKIVTDTAANWSDYSDSGSVILFLYNPFGANTLRQVLSKTHGRRCYIAYVDPEHDNLLRESGWIEVFSAKGEYKNDNIGVWFKDSFK